MKSSNNIMIHLIISGTLLFLVFVVFFFFILFYYKNKQKEVNRQKEQLVWKHARELLEVTIAEQELVMKEVSHHINDRFAPLLQFLRMNLHEVEALNTGAVQLGYINTIIHITEKLINDIGYYGHSLDSDHIKRTGLGRLLEDEAEVINAEGKFRCQVDIQGVQQILSPEQQLLIYRIAQEAVDNTRQHADADELMIGLDISDKGFYMSIADNGKGFDLNDLKELNGNNGLTAMERRAKLLNATLDIDTEPGKGTRIQLQLKI